MKVAPSSDSLQDTPGPAAASAAQSVAPGARPRSSPVPRPRQVGDEGREETPGLGRWFFFRVHPQKCGVCMVVYIYISIYLHTHVCVIIFIYLFKY